MSPKFKIGDYVVAEGPHYKYTGWICNIWVNASLEEKYKIGPNIINSLEIPYRYALITEESGYICHHEESEGNLKLLVIENMKVKYNGTSTT